MKYSAKQDYSVLIIINQKVFNAELQLPPYYWNQIEEVCKGRFMGHGDTGPESFVSM
jgi:hypothetical protein